MERTIRQAFGKPRKAAAKVDREVGNILDQHWLLVWRPPSCFGLPVLGFLLDFPGAVAMVHGFGLEPAAWLAGLMIFVLLVDSALVIEGRLVWLGAGIGGLVLASILAHLENRRRRQT